LTFHAIDNLPSVISFSPRVFRRGIARLHENGYRTLGLLEAVDCLRQGKSFPDRSFAVTFDDGYQTVYDEAFPVLQEYGMTATVFLTVEEKRTPKPTDRLPSLEGRSMLSWQEILEMQRWGIVFGAHTLTHPDLTRLPIKRIESEILESKTIIEDALNTHIDSFAYTYGYYDNRSREIVQKHFVCACSDAPFFFAGGLRGFMRCPRRRLLK
jgi:peptidoglycan/xylan/chitin deacetylase (PgdA/CDA1 family)